MEILLVTAGLAALAWVLFARPRTPFLPEDPPDLRRDVLDVLGFVDQGDELVGHVEGLRILARRSSVEAVEVRDGTVSIQRVPAWSLRVSGLPRGLELAAGGCGDGIGDPDFDNEVQITTEEPEPLALLDASTRSGIRWLVSEGATLRKGTLQLLVRPEALRREHVVELARIGARLAQPPRLDQVTQEKLAGVRATLVERIGPAAADAVAGDPSPAVQLAVALVRDDLDRLARLVLLEVPEAQLERATRRLCDAQHALDSWLPSLLASPFPRAVAALRAVRETRCQMARPHVMAQIATGVGPAQELADALVAIAVRPGADLDRALLALARRDESRPTALEALVRLGSSDVVQPLWTIHSGLVDPEAGEVAEAIARLQDRLGTPGALSVVEATGGALALAGDEGQLSLDERGRG